MASSISADVIEQEYNLYLDSDAAKKRGHKFEFEIQPPIQTFLGSKAKVFLRDFTCLNTILNITGSDDERKLKFNIIDPAIAPGDPNRDIATKEYIFPRSRYATGKDFQDQLNSIFYNSSSTYNCDVQFTWDKTQSKMRFAHIPPVGTPQYELHFEHSPIFDKFLKFEHASHLTTTESPIRADTLISSTMANNPGIVVNENDIIPMSLVDNGDTPLVGTTLWGSNPIGTGDDAVLRYYNGPAEENYMIADFKVGANGENTGTFTIHQGGSRILLFMVGGGGKGGDDPGNTNIANLDGIGTGGGGGGSVFTNEHQQGYFTQSGTMLQDTVGSIQLDPGTYTYTIGKGGKGSTNAERQGGDTFIEDEDGHRLFTAYGGGYGGGKNVSPGDSTGGGGGGGFQGNGGAFNPPPGGTYYGTPPYQATFGSEGGRADSSSTTAIREPVYALSGDGSSDNYFITGYGDNTVGDPSYWTFIAATLFATNPSNFGKYKITYANGNSATYNVVNYGYDSSDGNIIVTAFMNMASGMANTGFLKINPNGEFVEHKEKSLMDGIHHQTYTSLSDLLYAYNNNATETSSGTYEFIKLPNFPGTESVSRMFDKDTSTYFENSDRYYNSSTGVYSGTCNLGNGVSRDGSCIIFKIPCKRKMKSYRLSRPNGVTAGTPKEWTIYARNTTSQTWIPLQRVQQGQQPDGHSSTFTGYVGENSTGGTEFETVGGTNQNATYLQYAIIVEEVWGGGNDDLGVVIGGFDFTPWRDDMGFGGGGAGGWDDDDHRESGRGAKGYLLPWEASFEDGAGAEIHQAGGVSSRYYGVGGGTANRPSGENEAYGRGKVNENGENGRDHFGTGGGGTVSQDGSAYEGGEGGSGRILIMFQWQNSPPNIDTFENHAPNGESSEIIDFNRDMHNIYLSLDEAIDDNTRQINTASDIPGRIVKIPNNTAFGSYLTYEQNEPLHKSNLRANTTNKFTISLFDDSGTYFDYVDRFTCTFTIQLTKEIHEPELNSQHLASRHPPLLRP